MPPDNNGITTKEAMKYYSIAPDDSAIKENKLKLEKKISEILELYKKQKIYIDSSEEKKEYLIEIVKQNIKLLANFENPDFLSKKAKDLLRLVIDYIKIQIESDKEHKNNLRCDNIMKQIKHLEPNNYEDIKKIVLDKISKLPKEKPGDVNVHHNRLDEEKNIAKDINEEYVRIEIAATAEKIYGATEFKNNLPQDIKVYMEQGIKKVLEHKSEQDYNHYLKDLRLNIQKQAIFATIQKTYNLDNINKEKLKSDIVIMLFSKTPKAIVKELNEKIKKINQFAEKEQYQINDIINKIYQSNDKDNIGFIYSKQNFLIEIITKELNNKEKKSNILNKLNKYINDETEKRKTEEVYNIPEPQVPTKEQFVIKELLFIKENYNIKDFKYYSDAIEKIILLKYKTYGEHILNNEPQKVSQDIHKEVMTIIKLKEEKQIIRNNVTNETDSDTLKQIVTRSETAIEGVFTNLYNQQNPKESSNFRGDEAVKHRKRDMPPKILNKIINAFSSSHKYREKENGHVIGEPELQTLRY